MWKSYSDFSDRLGETAIQVMSPDMVSLFLAQLESEDKSYKTIRSYLSAISFKFRLSNLADPAHSMLVEKAIQGIKNKQLSGKPSQSRKPIDKPLLRKLLSAIPFTTSSVYDQAMFRAAFLLAHFACLRAGEISLSNNKEHLLTYDHFTRNSTISGPSYTIKFSSYKHSNHQTPEITLLTSQDSELCSVTALDHFLKFRGTFKGPLMQSPSGKALTRERFAQALKATLIFCKEQPDQYGTHSFRIGRATQLADEHVADVTIRQSGRWNSNAFKAYIRPTSFIAPS